MNKEPAFLTASEAAREIKSGNLSARELMTACAERIKIKENEIHAWIFFDEEMALRAADAIDMKIRNGEETGILCGVPVGVKDIFNTLDMPTCMGSPIWDGFTPGNDARVVSHLKWADAVIAGKTVTAEFAVHHAGPTVNPYNPAHTPGTSSSGSAAAVATHMVPAAVGTQTAGSTIRPSSYCGIYGFKPSFSLIPRTGILKTLDTLDHVACMARSVDDLEIMFEALRVRGKNHPFLYNRLDCRAQEQKNKEKFRVAFVKTHVWDNAKEYTKKSLEEYAVKLGRERDITIEEVTLPPVLEGTHEIHDRIYTKALSYYFAEEVIEHPDKVSDWFKALSERGKMISTEEYKEGLAKQTEMIHALENFFNGYDIILSLSTAGEAPVGLNAESPPDPCLMWTLCHAPTINLPLFKGPNNLPYGVQVVARKYSDYLLLNFVKKLKNKGLVADV